MLELRNIVKFYQSGTVNETCLFNDFSLSIPEKQFVCVVGSNGSGKTSLLNIICGSIPIDEGRILIGSEDITHMPEHKRHRRIGRVYQDPSRGTCPSMTILENMSMADNKGKPFNLLPASTAKRPMNTAPCFLSSVWGLRTRWACASAISPAVSVRRWLS